MYYGLVGMHFQDYSSKNYLKNIYEKAPSTRLFFVRSHRFDDGMAVFGYDGKNFYRLGMLGTNAVSSSTTSAASFVRGHRRDIIYSAEVMFPLKRGTLNIERGLVIPMDIGTMSIYTGKFNVELPQEYQDEFLKNCRDQFSTPFELGVDIGFGFDTKTTPIKNENRKGRENTMNTTKKTNFFGNLTKDVDLSRVKMTMFGLGIQNDQGVVQRYGDGVLTDVSDFVMDFGMNDMVFAFPAQKDQIKVGDLIVNNGSIVQVTNTEDRLIAIDFNTNQEVTLIPQKHAMGFSFITKVFAPMGEMSMMGEGGKGMESMFSNPMMMMLMMKGDTDMSGMMQMMMMSQMMGSFKI